MFYKWNSQLAKVSWCQRERWHHLPYRPMWRMSLVCGSGILLTSNIGHAKNI